MGYFWDNFAFWTFEKSGVKEISNQKFVTKSPLLKTFGNFKILPSFEPACNVLLGQIKFFDYWVSDKKLQFWPKLSTFDNRIQLLIKNSKGKKLDFWGKIDFWGKNRFLGEKLDFWEKQNRFLAKN